MRFDSVNTNSEEVERPKDNCFECANRNHCAMFAIIRGDFQRPIPYQEARKFGEIAETCSAFRRGG